MDPYGEDAIDLIVTGYWNPPDHIRQQAYLGFGLGAADGRMVIANAATLGLNADLSAQAQDIKAGARARVDVLSQVGFGLGAIGVEAGYAAAGGAAIKRVLTSGRGTAFVIRHAAGVRRATQAGSVVAAGTGGYALGSAGIAIYENDYADAIQGIGNAALRFAGAGFGAKTAPGNLGKGPLRIGSVPPPKNVPPGTTTFGNKMHEEIGGLMRNRFSRIDLDKKIIYRLGPGQRGVDIEAPRHLRTTLGFRYSEIKPQSQSGALSLERQVSRWGYDTRDIIPLTYRGCGDVFIGF